MRMPARTSVHMSAPHVCLPKFGSRPLRTRAARLFFAISLKMKMKMKVKMKMKGRRSEEADRAVVEEQLEVVPVAPQAARATGHNYIGHKYIGP